VAHPIICAACGAKFRTGMKRCPRCRAVVVAPNPVAAAAASRKLQKAAAVLTVVFALILGILWLRQEKAPAAQPSAKTTADPLASRRPQTATVQPGATAQQPASPERPFMDPSAKGLVAYAGGDFKTALAGYRSAVERDPQDAEAWSNLGQVLVKLNDVPQALTCFDRALALRPAQWTYRFNRARALGLLGRWDDAIVDYRQAQQLFPSDYVTTFNLGLALHKKGDEAAAVKTYQQAISLAPEDASFRMALGISLEQLGNRTEAAEAYREYLRLAPSAADADKVRAKIAQLGTTAALAPAPASGPGL
jgi:Flp pilus assembly protein TadD